MENVQKTTQINEQRPLRDWFDMFWAMVRKEFTIKTRYPIELFAGFAQLFIMIAVFTLATLTFTSGGSDSIGEGGINIYSIVVYGFIPFIFLTETLWGIGVNIRQEQLQGTLESVFLSPASQAASLISRVILTLIWTSLMSLMAIILMVLMTRSIPFFNLPLALYILAMTLLGTFGIGFAFAAITLRIKQTAQTLANVFQFSFMVFCAPFIPFGVLPEWVKLVSRVIPLAYGVDAFRSTLMNYPAGFPELAPINVEIWIVTLFGLLAPPLGLWLYYREEARARRRGSLGIY
ncbi:MAG: ABC transporter permease [Ardenticatenaceae bacterium]|nr:ABC transporter permease [Ardenticatenaceae bacterium]